ncbi:MAG TPA: lysophospholipid acyltransferase family protein [Cyclobacteriaceae bacterium]|nr:lysophospholipid acyltransferase family protein [Cyclobacteriaceae bacterium]
MKVLRYLYTAYAFIVFVILFLIFFFLFLIPIIWKNQFQLVGIFNRCWAYLMFVLVFMPFKLEYKSKLHKGRQYIFTPNHFSYLDIPIMGLNPINTIFVGKSGMQKIPLFGFMYSRLHITVDRSNLKSKYTTLLRSMQAIDEGKSLVIFPEGGVLTKNPPHMAPFKDGAFRLAIEKQIPIVPVSIPFNWIILPDQDELLLKWGKLKLIFHEPVSTEGMSMKDLDFLKTKVYRIIQQEIDLHNKT